MATTLPSTIRDDFITQIEAITPAETLNAAAGWVHTRSHADIPGSEIRTFALRMKVSGDGVIVGAGNDFTFTLEIHTSYAGLQLEDADPLIVEDSRQLLQTLAPRAGSLSGLQAVMWDGPFVYASEDDGGVWGYHHFEVRYKASASP